MATAPVSFTPATRGRRAAKGRPGLLSADLFSQTGHSGERDTYSIGKDFPRIAEILMRTSDDGRYVLAQVANGDGGEFAHYLMDFSAERTNTWIQVTHFIEKVSQAVFGKDHTLYLLSRNNAPRGKVLRVPLANVLANAETVVPQSEAAIEAFAPSKTLLYVIDSMEAVARPRFDQKGHAKGWCPRFRRLPVRRKFAARRQPDLQQCILLTPGAWYRYDPATGKQRARIVSDFTVDFSDSEVSREWAVSKDGTKIPMSVIRRKGIKLEGTAPTLLTGYGGYNISLAPYFDAAVRLWLDRAAFRCGECARRRRIRRGMAIKRAI